MRRPRHFLLPVALVVVSLAFVATRPSGDGAGAGDHANATAAAFRLPDVRDPGETVSLADRSGRPAVVNFLASWCVPCRDELPVLEEAHRRYGGRIAFVGVDHQDTTQNARAVLTDFDVTFPVGYDPDGRIAPTYRLRGLPTTVFVAADGTEVGRVTGRLTAERLDAWVARLQ